MMKSNSKTKFFLGKPARRFSGILLAMASLLVTGYSIAQPVPVDAIFSGFKLNGDFLFDLDGKTLDNAEIYLSDKAAAYLIIAPELASPVLVSPRTQSVESVSFMKVSKQEDGTIDLLADAAFDRLGSFQLANQEVVFQIKGQEAKLRAKPPLLGEQHAESLRSYKPDYARLADGYAPTAQVLNALRSQGQTVRVRTYFGTWCPVCGRLVPRIIKVAEELEGSKIGFEYYGLPSPMSDDPITQTEDLRGVPTTIVYVDGKEVGRLSAGDLNAPEKAIIKMVNGSKAS